MKTKDWPRGLVLFIFYVMTLVSPPSLSLSLSLSLPVSVFILTQELFFSLLLEREEGREERERNFDAKEKH